MRSYYEELWERLPEPTELPDFELRRRFLLRHARSGSRALDLGCGAGEFTGVLADAGCRVIGIDVAQAALARARRHRPELDFRLAAIDGPLPLEDNTIDLVWCSEVIEHVADTARWLSEVRRVLAPGGDLLLSTPSHGRLRVAWMGMERLSDPQGDHLHLYTRRSLRGLLEEFGFARIEVATASGPPLMRRMLLARAVRGGVNAGGPGRGHDHRPD